MDHRPNHKRQNRPKYNRQNYQISRINYERKAL